MCVMCVTCACADACVRVCVCVCVCLSVCVCHRPGSGALAAGAAWTLVTAHAPWAAREGHATVIDAAGAIYVIGGESGGNYLADVWASTDGGADRTRAGGWSRGTREYLWCAKGYLGVLNVYAGILGCTKVRFLRVVYGYFGRTRLNMCALYLSVRLSVCKRMDACMYVSICIYIYIYR